MTTDWAPTIVDYAGATATIDVNGRSLKSVLPAIHLTQRARHPDFPNAFTHRRKLPLPALIATLRTMRASSQQAYASCVTRLIR